MYRLFARHIPITNVFVTLVKMEHKNEDISRRTQQTYQENQKNSNANKERHQKTNEDR